MLKARGVEKDGRVTIYMPIIPKAAISVVACARADAVLSAGFRGFWPDSPAGRIEDYESPIIVTADEAVRGGRGIPCEPNAEAAADRAGGARRSFDEIAKPVATDRDPRADAGRRRSGEEDFAHVAAPARRHRRATNPEAGELRRHVVGDDHRCLIVGACRLTEMRGILISPSPERRR